MTSTPGCLTVVGIGADGWDGLSEHTRGLLTAAPVLLGGSRHLDLVPPVDGQRRLPWPSPLRAGLPSLLKEAGPGAVALASGDPLVSGIGTTLVDLLGAEAVEIVPAVSSVALARARMGWAAEQTAVVTVVGRALERAAREFAPGRRLLVLGSDEHTPARLCALLTEHGFGDSVVTVLGDLGGPDENRITGRAVTWDVTDGPRLAVTAVEVRGSGGFPWSPGLPDDAFDNDGQLTKRDVRASALSRLAPRPGDHLWDLGAGAGSVGIEWMRLHPTLRTTAVEGHPERADRIVRNAARLGVPDLHVVRGRVPEALTGLDRPDAIFVGGGAGVPGLVDRCLTALDGRGRLVIHAVTLETEAVVADAYRTHGGELTRLSVQTSAPIGRFTGWTPGRTITQWSLDLD